VTDPLSSTALNSLGDAVIITDREGLVIFLNPEAEALTGWKLYEVMGKGVEEILNISKKENFTLPSQSRRSVSGNYVMEDNITESHTVLQTKEGKKIPVWYRATPISRDKDKALGLVLMSRYLSVENRADKILKHGSKQLRKAMEGTIKAISLIVETRDRFTAGHQRRVANLACAITEKMGLSEEKVNGILVAGVFHDIGKIYLPKEILNKPGKLTEKEFSVIMNHSHVGYEILKAVEFPWPIAQIVLQHHERMDGSGYPEGLMGKDIMLEARILAVADVVEAMSADRPYRKALGIEKALEEIEKGKGLGFDSDVVEACLKLFREDEFKFE